MFGAFDLEADARVHSGVRFHRRDARFATPEGHGDDVLDRGASGTEVDDWMYCTESPHRAAANRRAAIHLYIDIKQTTMNTSFKTKQ